MQHVTVELMVGMQCMHYASWLLTVHVLSKLDSRLAIWRQSDFFQWPFELLQQKKIPQTILIGKRSHELGNFIEMNGPLSWTLGACHQRMENSHPSTNRMWFKTGVCQQCLRRIRPWRGEIQIRKAEIYKSTTKRKKKDEMTSQAVAKPHCSCIITSKVET